MVKTWMSGTLSSKPRPSKSVKQLMGQGGFEHLDDTSLRSCHLSPRSLRSRGTTTCTAFGAVIRNAGAETTNHTRSNPSTSHARPLHSSLNDMSAITIQEAAEAYLSERETELSDSSIQNHRYQIKQFKKWCKDNSINTIDSLEAIDISRFRRDRSTEINNNTLYNQLSVLRLFLSYCSRMQWCDEHLSESIVLPRRNGQARHTAIDSDRVEAILSQLEQYRYASVDHVILALLWTTGMRIGALRSLDVQDVHTGERWLNVAHRPTEGTPLKNKNNSERQINLHDWVAELLDAWMSDRRPDSVDGYGRSPLIATKSGRAARSTIRGHIYRLTACASLGSGCECSDFPSKCDEAVAPHDIRRSSISCWLQKGVEPALLSDRVDTSTEMMDKHYDVRSEEKKRERRRDAFDM